VHPAATRNPHRRIAQVPDVRNRHQNPSRNPNTLPVRHLHNSLIAGPLCNFHKGNIGCFDNVAYYSRHIMERIRRADENVTEGKDRFGKSSTLKGSCVEKPSIHCWTLRS